MTPEQLAAQYRADVRAGRDVTVAAVLAVFAANSAADETFILSTFASEATYLAAVATVHGIARQVALADRYLALVLTVLRKRPVPALGLLPGRYAEPDRLEAAFTTALESYDDPGPSVTRIAGAEVVDAGRAALADGMETREVGWTRNTGGSPCPLCASLADGSVLPPSVPMASHPGCSCVATIVEE